MEARERADVVQPGAGDLIRVVVMADDAGAFGRPFFVAARGHGRTRQSQPIGSDSPTFTRDITTIVSK